MLFTILVENKKVNGSTKLQYRATMSFNSDLVNIASKPSLGNFAVSKESETKYPKKIAIKTLDTAKTFINKAFDEMYIKHKYQKLLFTYTISSHKKHKNKHTYSFTLLQKLNGKIKQYHFCFDLMEEATIKKVITDIEVGINKLFHIFENKTNFGFEPTVQKIDNFEEHVRREKAVQKVKSYSLTDRQIEVLQDLYLVRNNIYVPNSKNVNDKGWVSSYDMCGEGLSNNRSRAAFSQSCTQLEGKNLVAVKGEKTKRRFSIKKEGVNLIEYIEFLER